ncbi:MAG: DUF4097 domain-containing protein [Acidobacteriota bacterium]
MRRTPARIAWSLSCLLLLTPLAAAEVTRTLEVDLSGEESGAFAIENLAGALVVRPGSGERAVATATVHAESTDLADAVRFERVDGRPGRTTLRVRYPLDEHRTFRYPAGAGGGLLSRIFGSGGSTTRTSYDGRRVTVSSGRGVLLYADIEVRLPARPVDAAFSNAAGPMSANRVEGSFRFDTGSGDVAIDEVRGSVEVDTGSGDVAIEDAAGKVRVETGSGDVSASRVEGTFSCDTGSGDCVVEELRGDRFDGDTGSGNITVRSSSVGRITADTGSGDISVEQTDLERLRADTGSGDIDLSTTGERLSEVEADTGSGDVTLRLGPEASFEVIAEQGSGELVSAYPDARPIQRDRQLIGYRRGDARIRIRVETGSGDVRIEPGSASARRSDPK